MKMIPNIISLCRILLSIGLIFVEPFSTAFYVMYITCGLSDIIDGPIARKTGTASRLGEKLDSAADLIMVGVLMIKLLPVINITFAIVVWIVSICIIRFISMAVAYKKHKTFAILHTYGNKASGLALFVLPLLLPFPSVSVLMYIICALAAISAVEELIIHLTSSQLQANRKGLFLK